MPRDFFNNKKIKIVITSILIVSIVLGGGTIGYLIFTNFDLSQETKGEDNVDVPDDIVDDDIPEDPEVPHDSMIKVGIILPNSDAPGYHIWEGAYLAAYEINTNGGVSINGTTYYIGLAHENTHETDEGYVNSQGVYAVNRMLNEKGAEYLIGGFDTEAVLGYMEPVMDAHVLFFGAGVAGDVVTWGDASVIDGERSERINSTNPMSANHQKYKYFFRTGPYISTYQYQDILNALFNTALYQAGQSALMHADNYTAGTAPEYIAYENVTTHASLNKLRIFRENSSWNEKLSSEIYDYAKASGIEIDFRNVSTDADIATYDSLWDEVIIDEVQMVLPLISTNSSISMMTSYGMIKPHALVVGCDLEGSQTEFWRDTTGNCTYETFVSTPPSLNISVARDTGTFYNAFIDRWDHAPLSMAAHAYDSVKLLKWAIEKASSFDTEDIISALESLTLANPLQNVTVSSTKFAFTETHDPWPSSLATSGFQEIAWGQWQDGKMVPVRLDGFHDLELYDDNFLHLPPWGIYGITA